MTPSSFALNNLWMKSWVRSLAPRVETLPVRLAVSLPGGARLGAHDPEVTLVFTRWSSLAAFAAGRMGAVAADVVEGRARLEGAMRPVMQAVASLLPTTAAALPAEPLAHAGIRMLARLRSLAAHTRQRDARQIRFHYDVSDAFYALWLDPLRVYSCAYFGNGQATLDQAQEAKLDLICRKLMLRPDEARQALEAQAGAAAPRVLRAYRLYLAGCAMAFERGWLALHQIVATRPTGDVAHGRLPGAQSDYPFSREHLHTPTCFTSSSPKSPAT